MIVLRPSLIGDIPDLRDVEIDAGQIFRPIGLDAIADSDPTTTEVFAEHILDGRAWTAELGSAIAGCALASVVDGEGHLDQISVRRAAAGRGLGRLLIDQVCRWAVDHGHDALTLTTFVGVPWNGPYYERLGFRVLPEADCGPQLKEIRQAERRAGVDVAPRAAMRLRLAHRVAPESAG